MKLPNSRKESNFKRKMVVFIENVLIYTSRLFLWLNYKTLTQINKKRKKFHIIYTLCWDHCFIQKISRSWKKIKEKMQK